MSTISIEMNTDYQSAHRFPAWTALSVFSTVCLAAIATENGDRGGAEKWVLTVSCLSLILSFLAVLMYLLMRAPFVGQSPEGAVLVLLTVIWCTGLPVIMNPTRAIAVVNESGEGLVIINANLYFFCWLSLASIMYLGGSFAQESAGLDATKTPPKTARWYGLCASSVVVFGAAIEALNSSPICETYWQSSYCRRTRWAIGLGVTSAFLSGAIAYLAQKGQLQLHVETMVTTVLLILWSFGVGFITFGNTPGATISNLYFASWISFILAVFLFGQNFRETLAARYNSQASTQEEQQQGVSEHMGSNPNVFNDDPDDPVPDTAF